MKVSAVIPAAGKGKRMQTETNKQFLTLKGKEILARTLEKLELDTIDEIIVVTGKEDVAYCQKEIIEKYNFSKVKKVVAGGKTRQASVYNGLKEVAKDSDVVMIHDGVRPFVNQEMIENSIKELENYEAVAVGVSVKDTIKVTNKDNIIINTPDRSKLVAVHTPQVFKKELILKAYQEAFADNYIGTDSASLVEKMNKAVKLVKSSYKNIKITTPEDLLLAEKFIMEDDDLE